MRKGKKYNEEELKIGESDFFEDQGKREIT